MGIIKILWNNYLLHIIDILIMAYVLYRVILFIKGTRGLQVLYGLIILALLTIFTKQIIHFKTLGWLLTNFWVIGVLVIAIVFQPELRSALARLGSEPIGRVFFNNDLVFIKKLTPIIREFAKRKIGALIIIEQETRLRNFIDTGITINGEVSKELLLSILQHGSILHDGAVIVRGSKISAAGCILPLSDNPDISKILGTRHRAGLGISEISDALAIIVSEETGSVSLAYESRIDYNISIENLENKLTGILKQKIEKALLHKSGTNV